MIKGVLRMSKGNLNINGSGSSGGGEFDKVSINGSGKILGDLKCEIGRAHV